MAVPSSRRPGSGWPERKPSWGVGRTSWEGDSRGGEGQVEISEDERNVFGTSTLGVDDGEARDLKKEKKAFVFPLFSFLSSLRSRPLSGAGRNERERERERASVLCALARDPMSEHAAAAAAAREEGASSARSDGGAKLLLPPLPPPSSGAGLPPVPRCGAVPPLLFLSPSLPPSRPIEHASEMGQELAEGREARSPAPPPPGPPPFRANETKRKNKNQTKQNGKKKTACAPARSPTLTSSPASAGAPSPTSSA